MLVEVNAASPSILFFSLLELELKKTLQLLVQSKDDLDHLYKYLTVHSSPEWSKKWILYRLTL